MATLGFERERFRLGGTAEEVFKCVALALPVSTANGLAI
jgi:hypothetical protein